MKASKHRPTVARVDLDAIAFNVQQVSDHIPSQALKYASRPTPMVMGLLR